MEKKSEPKERHIAALATKAGFINCYFEMVCEYTRQEDAYEAVERIYQRHFFKRRFKNFESFKTARNRFLKGSTDETNTEDRDQTPE